MKQQINQSPKPLTVGKVCRNRVVFAFKDLVHDLMEFSSERLLQCAKLKHNAAESPHVAFGVVRLASPYFRSDVVVGSSDGRCLDLVFRSEVP